MTLLTPADLAILDSDLELLEDPDARDESPAGRAIPGLPGWYETKLKPRLSVLAHESGKALAVYVRHVGWGRPQPFVVDGNGVERRFGRLAQACAFALEG